MTANIAKEILKVTKKAGLSPLSRKYSFGKTTWGIKLTPSLFRLNSFL